MPPCVAGERVCEAIGLAAGCAGDANNGEWTHSHLPRGPHPRPQPRGEPHGQQQPGSQREYSFLRLLFTLGEEVTQVVDVK